MSGLSGIYAFTDSGKEALQRLERSMDSLRHRGPDGEGIYLQERVGLAHRRLAIIAPSEEAHQPMQDASGRYTIVFDGHVFNYKELRAKLQAIGYAFRTDSDTEVVLQLYRREGQEFLRKLRGSFVMAIHDKRDDSLFIARDRHGEKPLLYYKDADKFLFGSEMAALLALGVPREVDYTSLYQYLQLGYVPAPASMLRGVKKLLPGHFLYIRENKVHQKMWYRLPFEADKAPKNPMTYKQQQGKLGKLLEQAVVSRLTADVPVGALLDGSLNSSLVVALASRHVPNIKTFSLEYQGQASSHGAHDTRLVADTYKTDHTVFRLTTQDMYENMLALLDSMGEPFADSAALREYSLSRQVGKRAKCVLSGDGADELFGGYGRHLAEYQLLKGGARARAVAGLSFLWNLLPSARNSFAFNQVRQLQLFAEGAGMSPKDRYWLWASRATEDDVKSLLEPKLAAGINNRLYLARKQRLLSCFEGNKHNLNNVLCADWQLVLANEVLPRLDLQGMAHGLEVRSPFIDHKVVKFAFSLPVSSKIDASVYKKMLQDTFKSSLPKELMNRPERDSAVPLTRLLLGEARPLVEEYLADDFIENQQIFDLERIRRLRKGMAGTKGGALQEQVWSLVVFQHWWKKWMA